MKKHAKLLLDLSSAIFLILSFVSCYLALYLSNSAFLQIMLGFGIVSIIFMALSEHYFSTDLDASYEK